MSGGDAAAVAALNVILARVRCQIVHGQVNGGRCVNCISWAKTIGTPAHLPRLRGAIEVAAATAVEEALTKIADEWQQGAWGGAPRLPDRVHERIANAQYVTAWLRARVPSPVEEADG